MKVSEPTCFADFGATSRMYLGFRFRFPLTGVAFED